MRVDKITIKNFKGFEDKTFEFPSQFTVIIGNNATGKTSVLDALAVAVGAFKLGVDGITPQDQRHIKSDEIRVIWEGNDPLPQLPVEIEAWGEASEEKLSWKRSLERVGGRTTYKEAYPISKIAEKLQSLKRNRLQPLMPVIAYHGTGRLWAEHNEVVTKKQEESVLMGYRDCLSPKSSSKAFLSWYKTTAIDAQNFPEGTEKNFLIHFNASISRLIPEWTDMRYHFGRDELIGFLNSDDESTKTKSFNNLSDGYRNMIGMAADIIYRCIKLNPHLGPNAVSETPGIVLIDELDLHLHPKWQREIVQRLKNTFPKIQFVCTTHSPFIVQSLKADELINLDNQLLAADPYKRSLEENALYMGAETNRSLKFDQKVLDATRFEEILQQVSKEGGKSGRSLPEEALDELTEILKRNSDDPALVARLEIKKLSKLGLDETS